MNELLRGGAEFLGLFTFAGVVSAPKVRKLLRQGRPSRKDEEFQELQTLQDEAVLLAERKAARAALGALTLKRGKVLKHGQEETFSIYLTARSTQYQDYFRKVQGIVTGKEASHF